jgi:hypothetical protein
LNLGNLPTAILSGKFFDLTSISHSTAFLLIRLKRGKTRQNQNWPIQWERTAIKMQIERVKEKLYGKH